VARLPGRSQRFGAFYLGNQVETNDVPGELPLVGGAVLVADGTVVSPQNVLAELLLVGGAALGLVGTWIPFIAPIVLQGNANLSQGANAVFAGELRLVGNANLLLAGTGGAAASVNPVDQTSGIVAIGIRGGHS
jgi:hypothetical protein